MIGKKVIVIGGNVSGIGASMKVLEANKDNHCTVYEKTNDVAYFTCAMPYFIGGQVDLKDIRIYPKERMEEVGGPNYQIKTNHTVLELDNKNKKILVQNNISNETTWDHYDTLIMAQGASNRKLNIPGINHKRIFYAKTLAEYEHLNNFLEHQKDKVKKAIIIGAGFISLELIEQLKNRYDITSEVVEAQAHVLPHIDPYATTAFETFLASKKIKVHTNNIVTELKLENEKLIAITNTNKKIKGDIVIINIGVVPNTDFVKKTNLKMTSRGQVIVNEYLQTSDPNIYAAGDIISFKHLLKHKNIPFSLQLANTGIRQGHIVGTNVGQNKNSKKFRGFLGSSIMHSFGKNIATTGLNEKMCQMQNFDFATIEMKFDNKPYRLGDFDDMYIKILFDKKSKLILGASAFGGTSVQRNIDVIGTLISMGGTIEDMQQLEVCYNPHFNFAKSPLNRLGYSAMHIIKYGDPKKRPDHVC